jgi:methionyl-tRNA formyltransferase
MAANLGIEVQTPERARDAEFVEHIESRGFDALVVASYGQILSARLLGAAKRGGINLHASILPKYRGAAPIARAILGRETETGVTMMQMDKGMDTGDVIAIETMDIGDDETAGELEDRLADLAADMAALWLPRIVQGEVPRVPQDSSLASLAPKLTREEAILSFEMSAEEAYRRFRAFTPRPGATLITTRGPLKLLRCLRSDASGPAGTVLRIGPKGMAIGFQGGGLDLLAAQPENKRPLGWNDLANGWRLNEGDRL